MTKAGAILDTFPHLNAEGQTFFFRPGKIFVAKFWQFYTHFTAYNKDSVPLANMVAWGEGKPTWRCKSIREGTVSLNTVDPELTGLFTIQEPEIWPHKSAGPEQHLKIIVFTGDLLAAVVFHWDWKICASYIRRRDIVPILKSESWQEACDTFGEGGIDNLGRPWAPSIGATMLPT